MKKLFLFALIALSSVDIVCTEVFATPNFSVPLIQKTYEQVNIRIDAKTSKIALDENARSNIEQKKADLGEILKAIDSAFIKKDKTSFQVQVKLFRLRFKETMESIQSWQLDRVIVNTHKNIPSNPQESNNTDITYYADRFEWGRTANGNSFSQAYFSAATCQVELNSLAQIMRNGTSLIVKINDRPNCTKYPRLTDLTTTGFRILWNISSGKIPGSIHPLGPVWKNYVKKTIPTDTFTSLGITLDANIPNTYLQNETLHISGTELLGKDFTILYMKSPSWKDITLGMKKWWDGTFAYNFPLEEAWIYELILASGLGFKTSTFLEINVLKDVVFAAKKYTSPRDIPKQIEKLDIERIELPDFTAFYIIHMPSSDFHTLTIRTDTETFVYRGFESIAMRALTLESLNTNNPVSIEITSQKSSTTFSHDTYTEPLIIFKKTMLLSPGFREEKNENISIEDVKGNLVVRWIIKKWKQVKSDIIITLPDGNVEKYTFDKQAIDTDGYMKRGIVFEQTIPLKQNGVHMIEVNYSNGFAAYNGPLTKGEVLALLPSISDSTEKNIDEDDSLIINQESLIFINNLRTSLGKKSLVLDDTLNTLATIKAQDMATHNNLSHTDSQGENIGGTAKRNGIKVTGWIGENIAGGNIGFRILLIGLANSWWHRANMLDEWIKMWVGYVIKDGQIYYAQVFGE